MVRVRDECVKHVAEQIQRDGETGEPAEHDHDSVIAPIAPGVRENLSFIIHLKSTARGNRRSEDLRSESAQPHDAEAGRQGADLRVTQPRGSTFMTHLLLGD